MDIDSPPAAVPDDLTSSHKHLLSLPSFSSSFPLPFRVLFLIGLAQLLWATNLHVLHTLGLDTSWILDFRDPSPDPLTDVDVLDDGGISLGALESLEPHRDRLRPSTVVLEPDTPTRARTPMAITSPRPESGRLYQPVYKLFLIYTAWVGSGWLLFRVITGGEVESMERWRGLVGVISIGAGVGAIVPWRGIGERERTALRRAIKRILVPSLNSPIYFCDVILADILTSFAKVLGDLWISTCQIWYGGITQGRVAQTGWANYITLIMVCFPYMMRFRQCMLEAYQSGWSNMRPLANALKYFSAFPVILLSALQKSVVREVAEQKGMSVQALAESGNRWYGEHPLFRLWLLAVVFNSMFSFWWDIEMDWGLALCEADTWFSLGGGSSREGAGSSNSSPGIGAGRRGSDLTLIGRIRRLMSSSSSSRRASIPQAHQRSPCPTPSPTFSHHSQFGSPPLPRSTAGAFFAFGLRPILLLPDPLVYHLFAAIDLVLRFTWSLKLSSHLHTISEIESGVFLMEALELVRRWMWVFIRVEWEAVKKGEARSWTRPRGLSLASTAGGVPSGSGGGGGTVLWDESEKGGR